MSKAMHFEKSMRELEEIVANLEKGEHSLDACLKLYEKGMDLAKKCEIALSDAEKKVKMLQDEASTTEPPSIESFSDE